MAAGFTGRQHTPDDWPNQPVSALPRLARFILRTDGEHRQHAILAKILGTGLHRQHAKQFPFAISSFVAMPFHIPGKDSDLVKVIRRSVMRLGDKRQVLSDFSVAVLDLVQLKAADDALPFSVLRNL